MNRIDTAEQPPIAQDSTSPAVAALDLPALFKDGRLGSWSLEIATGELTTSAACRNAFGRHPGDSFGYDDLRDAVHPGDRARMLAAFDRSLSSGCDYDIEHRIVTPHDEVRWVHVLGQVADGADGRPARISGVSIDVTQVKASQARHVARASLGERFRDLDDPAEIAFAASQVIGETLEVSRVGYGTIDPLTETISIERDWNAPGVKSLAGVLHFRDYGSYIDDLKRGETVVFADAERDPRTLANAHALKAISAQAVVNMPLTELGGFVALLYVNHATARPWSESDLAFIREIGERTRSVIARRLAEHRFRDLAMSLETQVAQRTRERDRTWNKSQDLLVVIGLDGVFRAANPAWTHILGWRVDEVVGRSHLDFVHPDDRGGSEQALRTAAGAHLPRFENRVRHRDGSYRWVAWVASPEAELVYASGRHVTAEKEAAIQLETAHEQLRQSQKMEAVGQLTGGLAHDFNNLLTGITGSLELLELRVSQGRIDEIDRYVRAAQGAVKRAAALTHRLLAFSRRQTLEPRPVDVNRLIGDMEDLIRRTVGPHIEIEVVGATGLWPALVDLNQLENALLNLCINARDAMPDGGRLTIETANKWLDEHASEARDLTPGQYLALSVSDTGVGMSTEVIARAFDPFFTTKPLGAGTGLGLSMVYGFARQSGGHIRIYSELDQGTTMTLYLPRHHAGGTEVAVNEPMVAHEPVASGKIILIVDDEPTVRMLVKEIAQEEGFDTLEAGDGTSALKILQSDQPIDLLITDVGLPGGINGRQVADAAQSLRAGLKVLFITGYAANAAIGNGMLGPGTRVLTKPFTVAELSRRIEELIDA